MKKVFFSLLLAFTIVATAFAQEESEHLTFKGVPIDGTLNEYVAKMKQAGFTHISTQDGTAVLQGDFAGLKDCTVLIYTLDAINVVSKICVLFPECNVWSSLEQNYNLLLSGGQIPVNAEYHDLSKNSIHNPVSHSFSQPLPEPCPGQS